MTTPVETYDTVDRWLDWGDHTVTVDPMIHSAWIHEGQDGKHLKTMFRGRDFNKEETYRMHTALQSVDADAHVSTYLPKISDIKGTFIRKSGDGPVLPHGVAAPFDQWYFYRGKNIGEERPTQLPIVQKLHRTTLPEVDTGRIERQVYGSRKLVQDRVHSKDGIPDHGLPC